MINHQPIKDDGSQNFRYLVECIPGVFFLESTLQRALVITAVQSSAQPSTTSPRSINSTYPTQLWNIINNQTIQLSSQTSSVLALPKQDASQVKIIQVNL